MLKYINSDGIPTDPQKADFLIVEFARANVDRLLTSSSLDRLLTLSDSPELTRKFEGKVSFAFAGFDADKREIFEIPEVVEFFQQLTGQWPFWFHFAERGSPQTIPNILGLLAGAQVVREGGKLGTLFPDMQRLEEVIQELFEGMNQLHEFHGIDEEENERLSREIIAKITGSF